MKEHKYKTIFSSTIHPVVNQEKNKYLAIASIEQLKGFLPQINVEKDYDLLGFSANSCNVNKANKNGDLIDTQTALAAYKSYIWKGINLEHKRSSYIGCIINAGFSEYGTDKPLKEEDVKDYTKPFNIAVGGVIWKVVGSKLIDFLEETNDPESDNYLAASLSFEVGFTEFDILAIKGNSKNLEDGRRISDPKEVESLTPFLKASGGTGKLPSGENVYRIAKDVTFLGVGAVLNPAADIKGILFDLTDDVKNLTDEANNKISPPIKEIIEFATNSENLISHLEKPVVIKDKFIMNKIKDISEVTDEKLTKGEITASTMRDFIEEKLKEPMEKVMQEKKAKEGELQAAKTAQEELSKNYENIKTQLETVNKSLEKIQVEAAEKEKIEKYNQRMAHIDETYELDVDLRKIVASDLQNIDEDSFKKVEEKYKVIFKDRNKEVLAKVKADKEKLEAEAKTKLEAKASTEDTKTVVEDALKNSEKEKIVVANTTTTETLTLLDRAKKAFGKDFVTIDTSKRRNI